MHYDTRICIASSAWNHAFQALICVLALLLGGVVAHGQARTGGGVSYYRDINPIFRTACIGCHSAEAMAGGLNLTSSVAAFKGGRGGPLVVAGKAAESR